MPKPTPEEVLRAIEDSELDEESDRIAKMTPEEIRRDLQDAGFDLAEVHAKADALHERMQRGSIEARVKELETEGRKRSLRPGKRRRPIVLWVAAAATVAVGGGGVIYAVVRGTPQAPSTPPEVPTTTAPPVDLVAAAELRRKGYAACDAQLWRECLARLDEAKRVDPAGDTAPDVLVARQKAALGIENGTKKPNP
jgi:hypothetical protein